MDDDKGSNNSDLSTTGSKSDKYILIRSQKARAILVITGIVLASSLVIRERAPLIAGISQIIHTIKYFIAWKDEAHKQNTTIIQNQKNADRLSPISIGPPTPYPTPYPTSYLFPISPIYPPPNIATPTQPPISQDGKSGNDFHFKKISEPELETKGLPNTIDRGDSNLKSVLDNALEFKTYPLSPEEVNRLPDHIDGLKIFGIIPDSEASFLNIFHREPSGSEMRYLHSIRKIYDNSSWVTIESDTSFGYTKLMDAINNVACNTIVIIAHSVEGQNSDRIIRLLDGDKISSNELHRKVLSLNKRLFILTCYGEDFGRNSAISMSDALIIAHAGYDSRIRYLSSYSESQRILKKIGQPPSEIEKLFGKKTGRLQSERDIPGKRLILPKKADFGGMPVELFVAAVCEKGKALKSQHVFLSGTAVGAVGVVITGYIYSGKFK